MGQDSSSVSDSSLIKAARSLDQSSADSVPETLLNLWTLLTNSSAGSFHASEELVLRWLLKNMNGTAEAAEKFRRFPMVWSIMACVFNRMPLISLARSLSDRRFIPILQQTLKEISNPKNAPADVEMADAESEPPSRKRKRFAKVSYDLESLRSPHGSLEAAHTLLRALQTLLARLELVDVDAPSNVLMGAEHVKSLFYSPAKEAVELLRPILLICDLALQEQETEPFEDQASWAAVFTSLWNLHQQSSGDAADVATSLYATGCLILAKLDRSKDLVVDPHVKATWTRDLRRFFIKNMILPARAAFLNRKEIGIIQSAVEVTSSMTTAASPVLFSLAVKAPHSTEDAGARKNHEDWTQRVFDVTEEPMREAHSLKRTEAMKVVLDKALESKGSVSLGSLRTVCKAYSVTPGKMDLNIVTRVANLDVDAFLISNEGHALLDEIIQQVTNLDNAEFRGLADTQPVNLVVSLAKGFAKGRNLSGFIKKWFEALTECLKKGADYSDISEAWSCDAVTGTVSGLLQSSFNTRQLLTILEWLDSKVASSGPGALLIVLDAISQGITEEEFIDAINDRLFEMISGLELKSLDDSTKARWWHIVESTISRSTVQQTNALWTNVEPDLNKALKKGDLNDDTTLAAFNCCSRFWLASYPEGLNEADAAGLTCSFLKRLERSRQPTSTESEPVALKFFDSSRLVDLLVNHDSGKEHLRPIFRSICNSDVTSTETQKIVYNEASLANYRYSNGLVLHAVEVLAKEQSRGSAWDADRVTTAAHVLLGMPSETIIRENREQVMLNALFFIFNLQQKLTGSFGPLEILLSLMAKLMERPTFYETMKFADLVKIGDTILSKLDASIGGSNGPSLASTYHILKLFEALAINTMKQMTTDVESRERVYLAEAAKVAASFPAHATGLQPHRIILLRSLIVALQSPKTVQSTREIADPADLRKYATMLFAPALALDLDLHFFTETATGIRLFEQNELSSWCALVSYENLDVFEPDLIRNHGGKSISTFLSRALCSRGWRAGWLMRELYFRCYGDVMADPLDIRASDISESQSLGYVVPLSMRADANDINHYIDIVLNGMGEDFRDEYFGSIITSLQEEDDVTRHLLALNRLLCADLDPTLQRSILDKMDLAKVHSVLSDRLIKSQSPSEFLLVAQTLHTLLDKKAGAMKQWNTEVTLSTVSIIAAHTSSSSDTYDWLCGLVEVIIKRHRLRLEGHFHLLTTALQALLRRLLAPPSPFTTPEKQAKHFARLLTLVCEPSVASVTRGQQPGTLDSAVDAAKRSAGQHMFLVLMSYIKLQLEHAVPRAVREALEPGVYAVLDITSPGGRRILNEAIDGSGRAIFRDMYKRYNQFGKWTGV